MDLRGKEDGEVQADVDKPKLHVVHGYMIRCQAPFFAAKSGHEKALSHTWRGRGPTTAFERMRNTQETWKSHVVQLIKRSRGP